MDSVGAALYVLDRNPKAYPPEKVNPPDGVKSEDWIKSGFKSR